MKQILYYLILGTKGGLSRAFIIDTINNEPLNANKLAQKLKLDYTTIKHHLKILEKHNILMVINKGSYGSMYFISQQMENHMDEFNKIWEKIRKD